MSNFLWAVAAILMGLFLTIGLFLVPPQPWEFWWWGVALGPLFLLPFGVWEARRAGRELWAQIRAWSPNRAGPKADGRVVDELVGLAGGDGGFANKARIREIGEALDGQGGIELM